MQGPSRCWCQRVGKGLPWEHNSVVASLGHGEPCPQSACVVWTQSALGVRGPLFSVPRCSVNEEALGMGGHLPSATMYSMDRVQPQVGDSCPCAVRMGGSEILGLGDSGPLLT